MSKTATLKTAKAVKTDAAVKTAKTVKTGPATKPKVDNSVSSLIAANTIIKLTIPQADVKAGCQKVLAKLAKTTKAPGFREGKAPLELAENVIGQSKLIEKTFNDVVAHAYYHAVVDQKKQPLTQPEFDPISLSMEKDWEVEAHFGERPEIKLGDYQKLVETALKTIEADKTTDKAPAKAQTEAELRELKLRAIFKALAEGIRPAIPELLLRQETRYELDDLVKNLTQLNLKLDEYVAKRNITTQDLSNELAATALGKLQLEFILGAIAADVKFTATSEDFDKALAEIKDETTRAKIKADAQTMRQLEVSLIRQKVVDYLLKI
ncbi:MAG TPA: hypothetical protein DEP87_01640 [Candidatus Pacebacteria bacterium]|nr:hypothetical protein [Candidatus Paceibacterota bacterium]